MDRLTRTPRAAPTAPSRQRKPVPRREPPPEASSSPCVGPSALAATRSAGSAAAAAALASLVLAAGFAVTDPTVQAAFTGIASAVVMLRDFVTDASFRLGVEMSEHVPLVVGRASSQAPSNPAACDETALTVWAGFAAASSHQVRVRAVTVLCHCTVQNFDVAFDQTRH